jgi:hypothetical protein
MAAGSVAHHENGCTRFAAQVAVFPEDQAGEAHSKGVLEQHAGVPHIHQEEKEEQVRRDRTQVSRFRNRDIKQRFEPPFGPLQDKLGARKRNFSVQEPQGHLALPLNWNVSTRRAQAIGANFVHRLLHKLCHLLRVPHLTVKTHKAHTYAERGKPAQTHDECAPPLWLATAASTSQRGSIPDGRVQQERRDAGERLAASRPARSLQCSLEVL